MRNNKDNICHMIENTVENVIITNNLINNNDSIVVAVSGGPDSMCLLNVLLKLKVIFKAKYNIEYSLNVAHVNHMIRKESDLEKEYVEDFCIKNNIPFFYLKENVPTLSKEYKMSEEACGRKVRYDFFEKVRCDTNSKVIATAHNQNDNVETILLNQIRGCGISGLIGMKYRYLNIIRPLLDVKKEDILKYNDEYKLNPCIDNTNFETIYRRNKIRLELLPLLKKEYNSNINDSILRMSSILKEDEDFLNDYTNNIVEKSLIKKTNESVLFDYSNILKEHIAIKKRCIRKLLEIKMNNLDGIENIHIMDIIKLLDNNIKGKKYIIGNKFTIEIVKKNISIIY